MGDLYSGKSILLVDDDVASHNIVKGIAKELSLLLNVTPVPDPTNALERYRLKAFDLVLVKEELPKMRGSFFIRKVLEIKDKEPPIAFRLRQLKADEKLDLPPLDSIIVQSGDFVKDELKGWIAEKLEKVAPKDRSVIQKSFRIDVNFINPFIEGTLKVLDVTCSTKAKKENVFIRKGDSSGGDISAVIGMTSPLFRGSFGISFSQTCFLGLVGRMLGAKEKEITKENQDAAGEICNQVFGTAKTILNEQGMQIQPAIPSVIVGPGHKITHCVSGPVIAVQFSTEDGQFTVEAALAG